MSSDALAHAVPHSVGSNRPARTLPSLACDSHMHVFDSRFAPSAHWHRRPPEADVAMYRQLQARLGTSRAVIVNPSTYGTDNACLLDALAHFGAAARGVAVVGPDVTDIELNRLATQNVCGLRVNFVSPQSWGETRADLLTLLADKAAARGWHIQVFMHAEQITALESLLATLPTPLVIDHMGLIDPKRAAQDPAYACVRRLLDAGSTWVKLSGAYMRSTHPAYGDTVALGQALVHAAPERMVWGSDWPHTTAAHDSVNDADLVDLLALWCGEPTVMDRILVDNPARLYGFSQA